MALPDLSPNPIRYGTVTWIGIATALDTSADPDDIPDMGELQGTIIFKPSVSYLTFPQVTTPFTVALMNRSVSLKDALIDDQGRPYVKLEASVADAQPDAFTWTAVFSIAYKGVPVVIPNATFQLLDGDTKDLTIEITPGAGAVTTSPGVDAVLQARNEVVAIRDQLLAAQAKPKFASAVQRGTWATRLAHSTHYGQKAKILSLGDSFTSTGYGLYANWTNAAAKRLARNAHIMEDAFSSYSYSPYLSTNRSGATDDWTDPGDLAAGFNPHLVQLDQGADDAIDGKVSCEIWTPRFEVYWWLLEGNPNPGDIYYGNPQYSLNTGARQNFQNITDVLPGKLRKAVVENWGGGTLNLFPPQNAASGAHALISRIMVDEGWASVERGVEWLNLAWPGVTSGWVKQTLGHYSWTWELQFLPFNMLHLGIGGNDMTADVPIATMKQNYRDIVNTYKGFSAEHAKISLVTTTMPYCDLTFPDAQWKSKWDQYFDAVVEVTEELGGMCIDMRTLFPKQSDAPDLHISTQDHHFSETGHALVGSLVGSALSLPLT